MKNKAKTTFISVIGMGFVLGIVIFMYYCKPTDATTATLETSNKVLSARVAELETFYKAMPENKQKIEDMTIGIKDTLSVFPADVREEDTVYFAVSSMQLENLKKMYQEGIVPADQQFMNDLETGYIDLPRVYYSSLELAEVEPLATIDEPVVTAAEIEGYEGNIVFSSRKVTYNSITDYSSLRGLLQSINYDPDKKTIDNFAYSLNDAGKLVGNVTVNYYWVAGTDREYEPKDFGEYEYGIDNLFGSVVAEDVEE